MNSLRDTKRSRAKFDIALTGIGVGGFEQITLETFRVLEKARIIFHLTSHHHRLRKLCKRVVSLEKQYWTGEPDTRVYKRIADFVLDEGTKAPGVVVVGDGHPAYYDDVTWDIYRRGRRRGLVVQIIPAISCIDSMASTCELQINSSGIQILEATTLVALNQSLNPFVNTLIMQIGWFGTSLLHDVVQNKSGRFKPLVTYLQGFYPKTHGIRILKAPRERNESPVLIRTSLARLDRHHRRISTDACLFVPALAADSSDGNINEAFVRRLDDKQHLLAMAEVAE
jgi:uncharacterized protein YabN with tetrapyrrole methylase and pyrophosphatase domain